MAASPDESATTVLIVDDERNVADLYATWVEMEADYETRVVYDGESALEALDTDGATPTAAVDVVLLDRRMPGMAGDEVLATIRDRGYAVPVAMVTAVNPDDAPLEADYQEYLTKPVMRDDIRRVVRALVNYDTDEDDGDDTDEGDGDEEMPTPDRRDDPQVSEDVRETLNHVTEQLDEIQQSVEHDADTDTDTDTDADDDLDLVTAEDIRTTVSGTDESDEE